MATKTRKRKKWEPGDQTPFERVKQFSERLKTAVRLSGQADVAGRVGLGRFRSWLNGKTEPLTAQLIELATILEVDWRWLATGQVSPAGLAAIKCLSAFLEPASFRVIARDRLQMLPQPMIEPGRCRYCACIYEMACPEGCEWVDADETICSACLDPESSFNQERA